MNETYEVCYGGVTAGKVQILKQGLYLRVVCRCQIPDGMVCRLYAQQDDRRENLGVLVPDGDGFLLDRKIPAKRLAGGELRFVLSSGRGTVRSDNTFIYPEEPFRYMERLKAAFLQTDHGKNVSRSGKYPEAG